MKLTKEQEEQAARQLEEASGIVSAPLKSFVDCRNTPELREMISAVVREAIEHAYPNPQYEMVTEEGPEDTVVFTLSTKGPALASLFRECGATPI